MYRAGFFVCGDVCLSGDCSHPYVSLLNKMGSIQIEYYQSRFTLVDTSFLTGPHGRQ